MALITPHFSLGEFACHDGTDYPLEWIDEYLRPWCAMAERIRIVWGAPWVIDSGYRTPSYNARVRGKPDSRHMHGDAGDVKVIGVSAHRVHRTVLQMFRAGELPDLGGLGEYPDFTHLDIRPKAVAGDLVQWIDSRVSNIASFESRDQAA